MQVTLLGAKYLQELTQHVDAECLPDYLGGTCSSTLLDNPGPWNNVQVQALCLTNYVDPHLSCRESFKYMLGLLILFKHFKILHDSTSKRLSTASGPCPKDVVPKTANDGISHQYGKAYLQLSQLLVSRA